MNIQCENCAAEHELDPPAWVLSSGRPFRFRCSVCGHSQMASPPTTIGLREDAPTPGPTARRPALEQPPEGTAVRASAAPTEPRPAPTPVSAPPSESADGAGEAQGVFLKQDGKVYLVKDWATLQRWIMERRVGREDLVSDGGVRWEPIGSRAELGSFFAAVEQLEAAELAGLRGGDTPFPTDRAWGDPVTESVPASGLARLDDETEGVPMGLPPLPTEDLEPPDAGGEEYPDQPPSRLSAATPAPDPAPEEPEAPPHALDPTPSMPMFAEEDEVPVAVVEEEPDEPSEPPAADPEAEMPFSEEEIEAPVDAEPEPEDADDAGEPDEEPGSEAGDEGGEEEDFGLFEERSVDLEEAVGLSAGDSVVDFADTQVPTEGAEDPDTDRPGEPLAAEPTDEFDPDDPFRDFAEGAGASDPDLALRRGPPRWLGVGAALVATVLVVLLLVWMGQNGYFGSAPPQDDVEAVSSDVPPPTPAAIVDAPGETDEPGLAGDTDGAVDTDGGADTDGGTDTDGAAADIDADSDTEAAGPPPTTPPPTTPPPTTPPPTTPPPTTPPSTTVSVSGLKSRGWAAIDKGQIPDAIDTFKRAVGVAPRDAVAQYGLGYAYVQAGDLASAEVHLCRAKALSVGNIDVSRQVTGELQRQSITCP